jgi:Domain of unknown function (DUF222)
MGAVAVTFSGADEIEVLEAVMRSLVRANPAELPEAEVARRLRVLERTDAAGAAVRGGLLQVFDANDGHIADGQRTARTWLVHVTGVTKAQAAEHKALQTLAGEHPVLHAALAKGWLRSKSVALQLAKWTRAIAAEYRDQAEQIVATAARKGADLRTLAAICAEIRARTAQPDPDDDNGRLLDRGVWFDTTLDGAGLLRGDLTPQCAAMVQAVLDALSAPQGADDLRTRPQRYHDALQDAMKRLLASDLLPKRAGQPVKALVHIYFAELAEMDEDSALQDRWIAEYRARWAAHRAAASVAIGDGGAWLEGDAARAAACDAMIIPVVTGDIDPGAIEDLITLCVRYHALRTGAPDPADIPGPGPGPGTQDPDSTAAVPPGLIGRAARQAAQAATVAELMADLEHQIIGKVLQVVSGPGGVASFLRRNLLGKGLNGPSLPLDVGATDDIPVHLRRLVALRDQTCQYPGGCDQPAVGCEPHHVVHRKDGGHTSLNGLKTWCWWHHHVVLHELGWELTVHPDGTSQIRSPDGKTIRSHGPPPDPG